MTNSSLLNIRPAQALLEAADAPQRFILEPIIAPGTAALIYGPAGVGKSFLALGLAVAAARGGNFLGWTAPRPHGVLYLDGEMGPEAVTARLRLLGPLPPTLQMWLAAAQEGRRLDLATPYGMERLVAGFGGIDLLIVDSYSSLVAVTGTDPERWQEMRSLIAMLQRSGIAIVMVHHANRDGAMRGIGRRADAMDLIIALRRPRGWQPADGARFEVHPEKTRHLGAATFAPIEARFCSGPDGRGHWQWGPAGTALLRRAADLLQQGMTAEAVGEVIGVSRRQAFRLQARALELGWIRKNI